MLNITSVISKRDLREPSYSAQEDAPAQGASFCVERIYLARVIRALYNR